MLLCLYLMTLLSLKRKAAKSEHQQHKDNVEEMSKSKMAIKSLVCVSLSGDSSHVYWAEMLRECFPSGSASCKGICPSRKFLKQLMIFSTAKFFRFQLKSKVCRSFNANSKSHGSTQNPLFWGPLTVQKWVEAWSTWVTHASSLIFSQQVSVGDLNICYQSKSSKPP